MNSDVLLTLAVLVLDVLLLLFISIPVGSVVMLVGVVLVHSRRRRVSLTEVGKASPIPPNS